MKKIVQLPLFLILVILISNLAFALDEVESGNTTATAQSISLSSPLKIKGQISPDADIDYYSFTAQAGNKLSAGVMINASTSISTDTEFRLLKSDGTTVVEADDDNGVLSSLSPSLASVTIPTTGTYYLEIKDKSAIIQVRPYYLYLVLQTASATAENPASEANVLPASKFVSGNLSSLSDQDFYSVTVNAGDTIFASLDLDPDRNGTNFEGQLVFVHPGATNAIPAYNDPGEGDSSADSEAGFITVKNAGTLLVGLNVGSGGTTFGNYQLQVAVFSEEDQTNCQTYTASGLNLTIPAGPGSLDSILNIAGSERIASLAVNLNLSHANMPDLDLSLISPSGNEVVLFTDVGSSLETSMDLILKDQAAIPIGSFSFVDNLIFQPEGGENSGRLAWFNGLEQSGNWTLRIRDDLAPNSGTLNSWSLTVCAAVPVNDCGDAKVEAEIFSTDFETNNSSFTHTGTGDEWEYGLPSFAPIASCYSGSNCWKTDLNNTYNSSSLQTLSSPTIDLSAYLPPYTVNWAHKYNMEDAKFDQYLVEVEDDNNPASDLTLFEHLDGDMVSSVGNPAIDINQSAGWGLISKDITSLNATAINLNFQLASDSSSNYAGVAIDDVAVYGCLSDLDNDGTADINDGCPNDGGKSAPGICGCGVLDSDTDSDGTFDCNETCDSDPLKVTPGICGCGTADTDTDSDGTANCLETCDSDPLKLAPGICGCGIADSDTDSDGTADCNETCDSDPLKLSPGACGCGILDTDTDSDGTADCNETCDADPLKVAPGTCGCGTADTDSDSDGTPNCNETCDTDPLKLAPGVCGCGTADSDSDSDGTLDCQESCDNDPLKLLPGICGCGVADSALDDDSDGTPNCIDSCVNDPLKTEVGSCGCGFAETDTDSDGTADCVDQCSNDALKTTPGSCGCGTSDTDSDSDGTPDCIDQCQQDVVKIEPGICGCGFVDQDLNLNGLTDCLVNPELKAQLIKLSKAVKKLKTGITNLKKLKKIKLAVKTELANTINYANQHSSEFGLVAGANFAKLVKGVNKKVKKSAKLLATFSVDKKQANKAIKLLTKNLL